MHVNEQAGVRSPLVDLMKAIKFSGAANLSNHSLGYSKDTPSRPHSSIDSFNPSSNVEMGAVVAVDRFLIMHQRM
jgi:hypothetical protein